MNAAEACSILELLPSNGESMPVETVLRAAHVWAAWSNANRGSYNPETERIEYRPYVDARAFTCGCPDCG